MITEGSSGSQPQHASTPPRCGAVARNVSMRARDGAGDEGHRFHLCSVARTNKIRTQTGQFPGAPDEVLVSCRGQFSDLVQPGIARLETRAAAPLWSQARLLLAVEHRRGVIAGVEASVVGPVLIE